MDALRWSRCSQLFDAALDLPADRRDEYIARNCADDVELASAVRRLLAADGEADAADFLGRPPAPPLTAEWAAESFRGPSDYASGSRRFGPYRLLHLIGAGGMGEVHLAERADGAFEQRVALKLLPQPTPGLLQRFRQERQILARLEHPNIARLLDGGIGEHGIPYFAMEFVDGAPINRYVTDAALSVEHSLRLFLRVCDAVQYAHRNIVVHRDLKPSNILVTADGTAKLLDFGIAKVLEDTERPDATQTMARMFTLDYAAPEQIRGETITTATDVYALGVVLYELLTGSRPYSLRERSANVQQAILEMTPPAPSVALAKSGASALRARALRGDLDRIVLTALAKEPERRYPSAEALAADIRNYLDGRPVAARGDAAMYRLRKLIQRNRIGVFSAAIVAVALMAGTGVSLWQAGIARLQAQRAETKSRTAEAVKDYLLSVFSSANPYKTDGKTTTARDLLESGLDEAGKKLRGQPQIQAEIYAAFVETFVQLDQYRLADRAGNLALQAYREYLPENSIEVLRMEQELAQVQLWSTGIDGLPQRFTNLLARIGDREGEFAVLHAETQRLLEITFVRSGRFDDAATAGAAAVAEFRKAHAQYDYATGLALYTLANVRLAQGRPADTAKLIGEFLRQDSGLVGPKHPGLTTDVTITARYLQTVGRLHDARELMAAAVAARLSQFDEKHNFVIRTRSFLASIEIDLGHAEEAAAMLRDATLQAAAKKDFSADDLADMYLEYARALVQLGRPDDAHQALAAATAAESRITADATPLRLAIGTAIADLGRRAGNAVAALGTLDQIAQAQRARTDRDLPATLLAYARAARATDDDNGAQHALQEAASTLLSQGRGAHPVAREIELEWADLAHDNRREAARHLARAAAIACVNFGCDDARVQALQRRALELEPEHATPTAPLEVPGNELYAIAKDIVSKAQAASSAPAAAP